MEVSTFILGQAITALVTGTAAIVTNRVNVAALSREVSELRHDVRGIDQQLTDLPIRYVPRSEIELVLRGIDSTTKFNSDMLQAMIHGGSRLKSIEASGAPRTFTQITIEGVDGRGGLNRWEGRVPFLYLDNRKLDEQPAPLVTTGCGCALDLDEALTLPWEIAGRPATLTEIAADFAAIKAAPFGHIAANYARYTRIRLPDAAIDDLMHKRFAVFICALRHLFRYFDAWLETVKAGCLDLIYGTGVAGFETEYKHFIAAGHADPPDLQRMAAECGSNQGKPGNYDDRNQARAALFLHPELG